MWNLLEDSQNNGVEVDRSKSFFVGDAAGRIRTQVTFNSFVIYKILAI